MVVDYGFGNIPSVTAALREIGADPIVDTQGDNMRRADVVILPGVASFGPAKDRLERSGQADLLREAHSKERLIIGLCLGAQLLLDDSEEAPGVSGFGFVQGQVARMNAAILTVPNQGWHMLLNSEHPCASTLHLVGNGAYVYFSHSYQIRLADERLETSHISICDMGITASYEVDNIRGYQFHPELSGKAGLGILRQGLVSLE